MAKLTTLKPTLTSVSATIGYAPTTERERDQHRDTQHWRKWYRTARWKKLRWATLVRDRFTCQRCHVTQHDTSKLVADHDQPHRGDERLFWQASNIVTLCKPCHDGVKQRDERRAT